MTEQAGRASTSGLSAFRSSGWHVLDAYISACSREPSGHPSSNVHSSSGPGSGSARVERRQSRVWTGHIPADNVGFRLLKKVGWSVGSGLGAGEQGRREPIEPVLPKGTRGLGFDFQAAQQQQQQQRDCAVQGQRLVASRKRGAVDALDDVGGGTALQGRTARERVAAIVLEELASEKLADKVARHRQVMRAEVQQERGRAIERYLRSAFNDPFDHQHSDNSNPLSRTHKLTHSNPLLDPIGD